MSLGERSLSFIQIKKTFENFTVTETIRGLDYKIIEEKRRINDSKIHLLFWGLYFGGSSWGHEEQTMDENFFKKLNCPVTNCVMTHNQSHLPNISDFDAIIFNLWEENFSLPKVRNSRQLYIMISNE